MEALYEITHRRADWLMLKTNGLDWKCSWSWSIEPMNEKVYMTSYVWHIEYHQPSTTLSNEGLGLYTAKQWNEDYLSLSLAKGSLRLYYHPVGFAPRCCLRYLSFCTSCTVSSKLEQ